jgi:hypothetical protein
MIPINKTQHIMQAPWDHDSLRNSAECTRLLLSIRGLRLLNIPDCSLSVTFLRRDPTSNLERPAEILLVAETQLLRILKTVSPAASRSMDASANLKFVSNHGMWCRLPSGRRSRSRQARTSRRQPPAAWCAAHEDIHRGIGEADRGMNEFFVHLVLPTL